VRYRVRIDGQPASGGADVDAQGRALSPNSGRISWSAGAADRGRQFEIEFSLRASRRSASPLDEPEP